MKKELTIEHRCAYAPYGVQVLAKGGLPPYADEIRTPPPCSLLITNGKMILRPLSDLTREITHNGETFEPMQRLVDEHECAAEWDFLSAIEDDWASAQDKMRFAPMSIASKLHSWHFDTFGLIENCLAIDINTLTK